MQQCSHCEGFLTAAHASRCPHCDARLLSTGLPRPLKRVGQLVLGAGAALTLSACYGAPPPNSLPPCDETETSETQTATQEATAENGETTEAPCVPISPSPAPSADSSEATTEETAS